MEATVEYLGDAQFEVKARGHRVFCDQPTHLGGADEGMTPPEFLLASLGACAGYYAVEYLRARALPVEGLRVRILAEKASQPARLGSFRLELEAPWTEDERHREGVLRAVKKCLVHNTLLHPPHIEVKVATTESDLKVPIVV